MQLMCKNGGIKKVWSNNIKSGELFDALSKECKHLKTQEDVNGDTVISFCSLPGNKDECEGNCRIELCPLISDYERNSIVESDLVQNKSYEVLDNEYQNFDTGTFYRLLNIYKINLLNLSELLIEKEMKEKESHFISYPFRRAEAPDYIKQKELSLKKKVFKIDEEIESVSEAIYPQERELKELSENNK